MTIFVGIRLRIATRRARMSWWTARLSPITKMFSLSRMPMAGRVSGIFTGMGGTSLPRILGSSASRNGQREPAATRGAPS